MRCTNPFVKEVSGHDILKDGKPSQFVAFPCGKCLACRINKTREWSKRLSDECLYSGSTAFITLTYDDDHLPRDANDNPSVSYYDIRHFLARLRKDFKFRYFINSEYGPETTRPHYHGILFFEDKTAFNQFISNASRIVRKGRKGQSIISYRSFLLEKYWKGGNCEIGEVVPARCTYTAKYFINRKEVDDILTPNFSVMSRRPGIGRPFVEDAKEYIRKYGNAVLPTNYGTRIRTPRYYRKITFSEDELKQQFEDYINDPERTLEYYDNPQLVEKIRIRNRLFLKPNSKQL